MDDTDLRGLDLASAKEYIFAFAVDLKRLDKDVEAARAELESWKARVGLAESKGLAELAAAARSKAEELSGRLASLEAERSQARAKISRMREQLPMIRARERSVDPDRLLAELQLMTGELLGPSEGMTAAGFDAAFGTAGAAPGTGGAATPEARGAGNGVGGAGAGSQSAQGVAPAAGAPKAAGPSAGPAPGPASPSATQGPSSGPSISVDREFSKLEASLNADAALAALKRSMGLGPEPKAAEPDKSGGESAGER